MKILLLDNYDSFTYNLLHAVKELGATDIEVVRNDQIGLDNVERFDKIILSPGPGIPEEAGLLLPIIKKYAATKSILGVCLGHQAIGEAFGARLENLKEVYHGDPGQYPTTRCIIRRAGKRNSRRTLSLLGGQPGGFS